MTISADFSASTAAGLLLSAVFLVLALGRAGRLRVSDPILEAFGIDYVPPPYIQQAYQYARAHKWYGLARSVTINDLYAFNPDINPAIDDFREILDRHFRHPPEGLGYDNTPAAHMWRSLANPDAPL